MGIWISHGTYLAIGKVGINVCNIVVGVVRKAVVVVTKL